MRFAIRFGRFKLFLVLFGSTPSNSFLDVDDDLVRVRMGWSFKAESRAPAFARRHRRRTRP
jgi:hypothetical protein